MRRIVRCIACLLVFISFAFSSGFAAEKTVVGISTPTADHGWTGGIVWWSEKAVVDFGKQYPNIEFIYKASDSDKEQAADVEAMFAAGIDALVILPHKPAPLTTVLNKVNKSGAYIVVVDRSIPKVPKDVYLAGDNYGFGFECGVFMAEAMEGKGNILVMEGIPCEGNTLRVNGFKDGIKGSELVIMDSQPAYWDPDKGYELMQQYMGQFPSIDAIWIGDDDVLEGALRAYRESGREDVKLFLGGGGSKRIVKMIMDEDPLVRATVLYPPKMVYDAVALTVEHLETGRVFESEIIIPSELVTLGNAEEHYYPDNIY